MAKAAGDFLLARRLRFYQPAQGYRAAFDGVFLAASVSLSQNARAKPLRVLELGAGTGMVGLCLLWRAQTQHMPMQLVAIEKQTRLAAYNRMNIGCNGFFMAARVVVGDVRFACGGGWGGYDLVISNPPWRETQHQTPPQNQERAVALLLGALRLEDWVGRAVMSLRKRGAGGKGGRIALMVMGEQEAALCRCLRRYGMRVVRIWRLFSYKGDTTAKRVIVHATHAVHATRAVHARKGANGEACFRSTKIVLHEQGGALTQNARKVLEHAMPLP